RELRRDKVAVRDVFDFRVIVETGAARLAAERRRASDLPKLADLVSRMSQAIVEAKDKSATARITEFQDLDPAFHIGIAHAPGHSQWLDAVAEGRSGVWLPV